MIKSYIGYSNDENIRYKATSGGIGSTVIKYLFENNIIQTSITFEFNSQTLEYEPKLIYSYDEYHITGSIYHEIKLIKYIKEHINFIKGCFACFVLPCQAKAIRSILDKAEIKNVLLGLTCSSQQSIYATHYLLKRLNINRDNVLNIQYRGMGWPSGIHITLKNRIIKLIPNNNSIWSNIFHSRLFIQKRCFNCNNTFNTDSDISLADPWLKEIYNEEKIGQSIIICNTIEGIKIIQELREKNYINLMDINYDKVIQSQIGTINRKKSYIANKNKVMYMKKIFSSHIYRKLVLSSSILFKLHNKIKTKFETYLLNKTDK